MFQLTYWLTGSMRLVNFYQDFKFSFNDLFKDNYVAVHWHNLQVFAADVFKVKINTAWKLVDEPPKKSLPASDICWNYEFDSKNKKIVDYGTKSMSFLGTKI